MSRENNIGTTCQEHWVLRLSFSAFGRPSKWMVRGSNASFPTHSETVSHRAGTAPFRRRWRNSSAPISVNDGQEMKAGSSRKQHDYLPHSILLESRIMWQITKKILRDMVTCSYFVPSSTSKRHPISTSTALPIFDKVTCQ